MNGSPSRDDTKSRKPAMCKRFARCCWMVSLLALVPGHGCAWAQMETAANTPTAAPGLPDAPVPQGSGSLSGTVADQSGAAVRGAVVTVTGENGSVHLSTRTNRRGAFHFAALPPGNYQVSVSGPDLSSMAPQPLVLAGGQARTFPIVVTRIPHFTSTVRVTASPVQIATAQVHVEEKQRVLGVVPNFYTSFEWNAAPMTPKLKYHLALRSTFDPFSFLTDAAIAGAEQYHDTYPGYGSGLPGYGKRFGATLADSFDSRVIGGALLPALLHQDPRYFYRGKGSFGRRLLYALAQTFVCRGDQGQQEVNYSRIAGSFAAAGISNAYHSPGDRSAGITVRDGFVILGGNAAEDVLREFLSRGLTSHVPPNANGKP
jgi:Carboxypeptidase regulatory-like domain